MTATSIKGLDFLISTFRSELWKTTFQQSLLLSAWNYPEWLYKFVATESERNSRSHTAVTGVLRWIYLTKPKIKTVLVAPIAEMYLVFGSSALIKIATSSAHAWICASQSRSGVFIVHVPEDRTLERDFAGHHTL